MKTVDEDQKIKERLISFQTQVESTEGKLFPIWEPIAFTRQRRIDGNIYDMKVKVDENRYIHTRVQKAILLKTPAKVLDYSEGHTAEELIVWEKVDVNPVE